MKFLRGDDKFQITEKIFILLLIVFAVLGTVCPLLLKQFNLVLLSTYLSIPMISAAAIWIAIRNKDSEAFHVSENFNWILILIFLVCTLCSIFILYFSPVRTVYYYILTAVMGVLILAQILYSDDLDKKQSRIILLQIILLFLNIIWGVTLKYYFFIGRTDGLFHSWVIESLLREGHISQAFDIYNAFPLWHILCSCIYQIADLSVIPAKVMFIANGLIYGFLVLVLYSAASRIFNIKIALISSLLLCFNTDAIFYGMYSIPRSVIFFLEGLFIILLLQKKTVLNTLLCIFVIVGLILYHTASTPFIILILTLFYVLQMLYSIDYKDRFIHFNFILLIFILTVTYWMYAGVQVFNSVTGSLLGEASTVTLTKSIVVTPLSELFNYLQYSPLLIFVILGVLWGLRTSELNPASKVFLIVSLLLVPVTFPGPALLLNKLAGNFNLSRFGEYSFLFICIAGAAGIYVLFCRLKRNYRISALILFFVMAFLAVSNDFVASDNPLVKRPFYTYYLSEQEVTSFKTAVNITNGFVTSDYITCRYYESSEYADQDHILEVDRQNQKFLRRSSSDSILIRKSELAKRPLKLFTSPNGTFLLNPSLGDTLDYYNSDSPVWSTLNQYNTVYDSGAIQLYQ